MTNAVLISYVHYLTFYKIIVLKFGSETIKVLLPINMVLKTGTGKQFPRFSAGEHHWVGHGAEAYFVQNGPIVHLIDQVTDDLLNGLVVKMNPDQSDKRLSLFWAHIR